MQDISGDIQTKQRWLRSWQGLTAGLVLTEEEELLKNPKPVSACTSCMNMCAHTCRGVIPPLSVRSWDFRCLLSPRKQLQCCPGDWNAAATEAEAACSFLRLVQPWQDHPAHTWLHLNSSEITIHCSLSCPIYSCACPQLRWLLSWSTLDCDNGLIHSL